MTRSCQGIERAVVTNLHVGGRLRITDRFERAWSDSSDSGTRVNDLWNSPLSTGYIFSGERKVLVAVVVQRQRALLSSNLEIGRRNMVEGINWPLASNVIRKRSLSNTYGWVRHYADGRPKPHQGWDFEAVVGTQAFAIADGKVEFVTSDDGYGLQLCMSFTFQAKTFYAFYAHLQRVCVKAGDDVKLDAVIATTGKTGNAGNLPADEDHLHFEIRTQAQCGKGLGGRLSPINVFGSCPLHSAILAQHACLG